MLIKNLNDDLVNGSVGKVTRFVTQAAYSASYSKQGVQTGHPLKGIDLYLIVCFNQTSKALYLYSHLQYDF